MTNEERSDKATNDAAKEVFQAHVLVRLAAVEARMEEALKERPGEDLSSARALVRDVIAEELERFWERRFGGRP